MTAYVKIYLVTDKSNYAPKEMGSNKQRIRRRRNPPPCSQIWLKNEEFCGIICDVLEPMVIIHYASHCCGKNVINIPKGIIRLLSR